MMRCCFVPVLVVGFSTLTACGGASNGAFAPRLPATNVQPLSDVLYSFGGSPDAEQPRGGLLAGKKGEYYGTSASGGSMGDGAVYEITAAGNEKVLYSFQGSPDGADPQSTLIMDKEGALYGDTLGGGSSFCSRGCGTIFKLTPGGQAWTENVLYEFQGGNDGANPYGGLVKIKSGALLGTTYSATYNGTRSGVVFELTPSGSTYSEKVIHVFSGPPDGLKPMDALVSDSSGNLYGTTLWGGLLTRHGRQAHNWGTVFKLTPSGSTYTYSVIYRFKGGGDGKYPIAGLLPGPNGVLYGLTNWGGARHDRGLGHGTVFELEPMGSKYREKVLYAFKGHTDGSNPDDTPGLVADRSGNLYGTTLHGGGGACSQGCGTVFKLVPSGSGFNESVLYAFQGDPDGANPYGGVVIDSKGNLLGPTYSGGLSNRGAIFSLCCAPPLPW